MNRLLGPRWVLPAYWAVFLGATMAFHPGSALDARSTFIIAAFCTMFLAAVTFSTAKLPTGFDKQAAVPSVELSRPIPKLSSAIIRLVSLFGVAANIGAALVALGSSPYGLTEILTLQGLADSANTLAVARYEGDAESLCIFVFLGFGYVAALAAPFIRLTDSKRTILWAVLPAATSLAYAAVSSARLGFLVACALTVGGSIACAVIRDGVPPQLKFKGIVTVTLVGAMLAAAFIGVGVLRTGRVDAEVVEVIMAKQASYTVGTAGAFSSWYAEYGTGINHQLGYGTATIAGMEYLTGQDRDATRAYGEFAVIDSTGRTSNVYTAFRGLILDFGIDGTLIFLGVSGIAFGRLYLSSTRGSIVGSSLLGFAYASILFSGWLATTTFTNILAVAVVTPGVLLFARQRFLVGEKRHKKQEGRSESHQALFV